MQCIMDDWKQVLWISYSHKGGSHDSSCFRYTELRGCLETVRDKLFELGYYILRDSAYPIESFSLLPCNTPNSRTSEDDINCYHSSARITVECAFGEINLRGGYLLENIDM